MESSTNYSNSNTSNGNRNGNQRESKMGTRGGDGNHHVLSGMFAPLKRKGRVYAYLRTCIFFYVTKHYGMSDTALESKMEIKGRLE